MGQSQGQAFFLLHSLPCLYRLDHQCHFDGDHGCQDLPGEKVLLTESHVAAQAGRHLPSGCRYPRGHQCICKQTKFGTLLAIFLNGKYFVYVFVIL